MDELKTPVPVTPEGMPSIFLYVNIWNISLQTPRMTGFLLTILFRFAWDLQFRRVQRLRLCRRWKTWCLLRLFWTWMIWLLSTATTYLQNKPANLHGERYIVTWWALKSTGGGRLSFANPYTAREVARSQQGKGNRSSEGHLRQPPNSLRRKQWQNIWNEIYTSKLTYNLSF